jgi:hypothetical protein
MKKYIFVAFFAAFLVLLPITVFAQDAMLEKSATKSAEEKMEKVEYQLPYPGILPDNPLYFMKMLRDRITSFLISDPKKKAEFHLLSADKRLNAGVYLLDSKDLDDKKIELAISTISKAENYFSESIQKVNEARSQGVEALDMQTRLKNALAKHTEVVMSLENKISKNYPKDFSILQKRLSDFQKEIDKFE